MKRWLVDGSDVVDLFAQSREAIEYCRRYGRPAVMVVRGLVRRFGHAATDRQLAYLTAEQIARSANTNHLSDTVDLARAVGAFGGIARGGEGVVDLFRELQAEVEKAFDLAVNEEKITSRAKLCEGNAPPLAPVTRGSARYLGLGACLLCFLLFLSLSHRQ
jgi:TPP-dependent pyruvate/acetoin dehydrogenase alpha subunit